jgi:hypothetical protein
MTPFEDFETSIHSPQGIWQGGWQYIGELPGWQLMHNYTGEFYGTNTGYVHSVDGGILRVAQSDADRLLPPFSVAGHGYLEAWLDRVLPQVGEEP